MPLTIRDTVAIETPARLATSPIDTLRATAPPRLRMFPDARILPE
jgi:hypothetical protein